MFPCDMLILIVFSADALLTFSLRVRLSSLLMSVRRDSSEDFIHRINTKEKKNTLLLSPLEIASSYFEILQH